MKPGSWRRFRQISLKPFNTKAHHIEKATLRHANTFLVNRWENVRYVRRHIIGMLFLIGLLIGLTVLQTVINLRSVTHSAPIDGGAYVEGMIGPLDTLNPLFTTSSTEESVSRLLFSGLLKYDKNGRLRGDLASDWKIVDKGTRYVLTLKPNLTWHDGKPLTTKDIVFTVKTMQNKQVGANSANSWQGIKVAALDKNRVAFTLPAAYAPFASALNFPVLPEHLLGNVKPENLQESQFNKHPVGSGPFQYSNMHSINITKGKSVLQLDAFNNYSDAQPRSAHFTVYIYGSDSALAQGLQAHEVNAASGLSGRSLDRFNSAEFQKKSPSLNNGVYALLKNNNPILKDVKVRQALVLATDRRALIKGFDVKPLSSPIINSQLTKTKSVTQPSFDSTHARELFALAGWKKNSQGILEKNHQPLRLQVVAVDGGRYQEVLRRLKKQWRRVGVEVETRLADPQQIQQTVLRPRSYDVLVYELELGGDPDAYAYWHSSQSSGAGLNFTGYSSKIADDALITGRSRSDIPARDVRYATFARQWVKDAPAIALYRSTLSYIKSAKVNSISGSEDFVSASDRFTNVNDWTVRAGQVYDTP